MTARKTTLATAQPRAVGELCRFLRRATRGDHPGIYRLTLRGCRPEMTVIVALGITQSVLAAHYMKVPTKTARETRTCRFCGCSELVACPGGCSWLTRNVCTRCADLYEAEKERGGAGSRVVRAIRRRLSGKAKP